MLGRWLGKSKVQNTLIHGGRAPRKLLLIDEVLTRRAGHLPYRHRKTVKVATAAIRWFANTHALELVLVIFLKRQLRLRRKEPGWKVRFCL